MNHITKEKSVDIAREHLWRYKPSGHPKQSDAYLFNDECMQALCNAAIEWHIAQQAASVDATFKKWNAEHEPENEPAVSLASQRPINCGTGHCSCIECLYKKDQKTNTSQERVKKSEKSEQVPLTDEQCDKVLQRIDEWATGYGAQEYGLPLFWMPNRARDVLREALEIKV